MALLLTHATTAPRAPFAALFMLLALAGCGSDLKTIQALPDEGDGFTDYLAKEYKGYATSQGEEYDWDDADYFAGKGLKAAAGEQVEPEVLTARRLNAQQQQVLGMARARLVKLLESDAPTRMPEEMARAQMMFDCWVEQVEEQSRGPEALGCKYELASLLEKIEDAHAQK